MSMYNDRKEVIIVSIADKMVYLRFHSGLSTEEISARSGVPVGTINKIFTGETKNPTGKTASKLAKVFEVTTEYLLNDDIPIEKIKTWPAPVSESGPISPGRQALLNAIKDMDDDTARAVLEVVKSVLKLRGE